MAWLRNPEDTATASFTHAFIGVLFAVALGLMVVGVQGGYAHVETLVMTEANLAGDLYRDIENKGASSVQARNKNDLEWPYP